MLIFFFAPVIAAWYDIPLLSPVLRILSLKLIFGGINSVQIAYVQKNFIFKRYCFVSLFGTVLGATIAVLMAYNKMGVWALVEYNLVNILLNVILFILFIRWIPKFKFSLSRLRQMYPFAWKMLATKFVDQAYVEISQLVVGRVYSTTDLAFYNKGKAYPQMLVNNASLALSNVLFPVFSNVQDSFEQHKTLLRKAVTTVSYVMLPLIIGLAVCGDNFVRFVLTEKWENAIPYLRLICIYYLTIPFSGIFLQGLKSINKGKTVLILEITKETIYITLMVIFIFTLNSPISIAISLALGGFISFFIECFIAKKNFDYKFREIVQDVLPSLLVALLMGFVVYLINLFPCHVGITLLLQVVCGGLFYFFLTKALKFKQIDILFSMLKKVRRKHE